MPVVSAADSVTGLGRTGAQNLPKKQGRGLIQVEGRLVEFQAFRVDYPMPTDAGLKWLETHGAEGSTEPMPTMLESLSMAKPVDEIAEMAERIRSQWTPGMSGRAVANLLGLSQYGGSLKTRTDKVIAHLTATTKPATTTQNMPEIGGFTPEMA